MNTTFQFAQGSVLGRSHQLKSRNNQDASCILTNDSASICIVCDGCNEGAHSDVGAALCAPLIAQSIQKQLTRLNCSPSSPLLWQRVHEATLARVRLLAEEMDTSLSHVIGEYFLFTVVGVVITAEETVFFSAGDGIITVNGDIEVLGPFPGNAPPYIAYDLLRSEQSQSFPFSIEKVTPTDSLNSFLIGSDGLEELLQKTGHKIPGRDEEVAPLRHFWEDDSYFRNPDKVRRTLSGYNREACFLDSEQGIRKEHGLLLDDTTLIVGRRRQEE